MRKLKLGLLALLACLALVGCVAFAACGGDKDGDGDAAETCKITWNIEEHAHVAAEGYTALPEEVNKGTEIMLTITLDNGWEIAAVTPASSVRPQTDGKYKLTASKDLTVAVKVQEGIESITVNMADATAVYYAGHEITSEDVTSISVNYKTGNTGTVTLTDCIVKYGKVVDEAFVAREGEALAIGDNAFTVTYRGVVSAPVNLATLENETGVVGLVTLDLNGGKLTPADVTAYENKPNFKNEKGKVSWTFNEVLAEAITLPTPVLPVGEGEGVIEFPLLKWTGDVVDNKVPAGTEVSVTAIASYETTIVELDSIQLTTKKVTETVGEGDDAKEVEVTVPYLVMKGTFKAANEAYLFLFEGHEPTTSINGDTVTKSADSDEFVLEYDLRKLSSALVPEYDKDGNPVYKPGSETEINMVSAVGKWMDIKLCTKIGTQTITQEINLNDYAADFIVGGRAVRYQADKDTVYTYRYEVYTPAKDELNKADGSLYDGTEKLLKVLYEVGAAADFYLGTIKVEERAGKPCLVIPGECVLITTKEAAEAALTDYVKDLQAIGAFTGNYIASQTLNVKDDLTFEIVIGLESITANGNYVMHLNDGKTNPTSGDSNFNPSDYDAVPVKIGYYTYTLGKYDTGWGWDWFGVKVEDTRVYTVTSTELSVEGEGDEAKLYLTIDYTTNFSTTADAIAAAVNFDFQNNDNIHGGGWGYYFFDDGITVTGEGTAFTVKIDISTLADRDGIYAYTAHLSFNRAADRENANGTSSSGNGAADLKPTSLESFMGDKVEYNGKEYQLQYYKNSGEGKEYWGCLGLEVFNVETETTPDAE